MLLSSDPTGPEEAYQSSTRGSHDRYFSSFPLLLPSAVSLNDPLTRIFQPWGPRGWHSLSRKTVRSSLVCSILLVALETACVPVAQIRRVVVGGEESAVPVQLGVLLLPFHVEQLVQKPLLPLLFLLLLLLQLLSPILKLRD